MQCPKCYADAGVKNGFVKGVQRYKCKNCGCQYTRPTPHGQPIRTKIFALLLYLSGASMNMTGRIIGVTGQSVMRWIKAYDLACMQEQRAEIEEIKIDEMHHFVGKKGILWVLKVFGHTTGRLLGWECGDRSSATLEKLYDRSGLWAAKRVYTGRYQAYSKVIDAKRLRQGKQNT